MFHEGTVRASRSLREDIAKTLRQAGFKRASRLLREGFAEPPQFLSGESPSRRHRDDFATSSRRHHYGGFMNLHSKPSWTLQMGSTINPEPLRKAKDNFHRQRLVWRVNPECNFLLLRRPPKKPIYGFGRRKTAVFRSA